MTEPISEASSDVEPAFIYETEIEASPQRLWEALTDGEQTRKYWFDRRIESDWTPGSPLRFYEGGSDRVTDDGEVLEAEPVRRLAYTFRNQSEPGGEPHGHITRVAWDIEPVDAARTRLRLVHDQLASPDDVDDWQGGWMPILTGLQAHLEGRDILSPPFAPGTYH